MYDHNQTLLPESFLGLYVRNGRPVLEREALEARYEIAETLALQIATVVAAIPADDERARSDALQAVEASLLVEPAAVSQAEARWVISRVAEIAFAPQDRFLP